MTNLDIIRAWKDEEYRASLSEAELAVLPESPVGIVELSDDDLMEANGGTDPITISISIFVTVISYMKCPSLGQNCPAQDANSVV